MGVYSHLTEYTLPDARVVYRVNRVWSRVRGGGPVKVLMIGFLVYCQHLDNYDLEVTSVPSLLL